MLNSSLFVSISNVDQPNSEENLRGLLVYLHRSLVHLQSVVIVVIHLKQLSHLEMNIKVLWVRHGTKFVELKGGFWVLLILLELKITMEL